MMSCKFTLTPLLITLGAMIAGCSTDRDSQHPRSDFIAGIHFDMDSIVELAPGSDNWAVTWADDDHQYTTWGDGGGFGGDNKRGRVSMGVGRIEGTAEDFAGFNIWGGAKTETAATFSGKSYGILAVGSSLWMWKTGNESDQSAFEEQSLYISADKGRSWAFTGVTFIPESFVNSPGFYAPTFLQFGPGYSNSRDDYVYIYAPEVVNDQWDVQVPGRIALFRVATTELSRRSSYEFFTGLDSEQKPLWSADVNQRQPVFADQRGTMRTSVTYNAGLQRYLLITQMVSRFKDKRGLIGIFEASEPWGPWREVLVENPWKLGLQTGEKNVFWNFSNKWTSADGRNFSLVYTGPGADSFGAIRGTFELLQ